MKIRNKITFSFLLIVIIGGSLTLFFVNRFSQAAFKDSVGQNSVDLAQQTMDSVDRIIYRRLERWESYLSTHPEIVNQLQVSNQDFTALGDVTSYIDRQDKAWQATSAGQTSSLMDEVINNKEADTLRAAMAFYENQYGYKLFPEIFISNKYGAVIISSNRTSDYNQADENWWQKAKANRYFVSDISVDESANSYALEICIRIDDERGDFVGVLKVIFNIQELIDVVNEGSLLINADTDSQPTNQTLQRSMMINGSGQLVYSTVPEENKPLTQISPDLIKLISSSPEQYFVANDDEGGSKQVLYALARSKGYRDYQSQGWTLILERDTNEVYASVDKLSVSILIIILLCCLICIALGLHLSNIIFKPIKLLQASVKNIAAGDFNSRININSRDEIGELASNFDKMVKIVKDSRANIEKKVQEQTKDIINKSKDLEQQQVATLNILEDVEKEKEISQRLAKDLEKFQLAVANASDHIVITDEDGLILYGNKAAENITGFSKKEIIGKKAGNKELWGGLMDQKFYQQLWKAIKIDKRPFIGSISNKRKNGEKYDAEAHISPILDKQGEVKFFIGIERDITREKQIDRAKTEFVSLASHQLRTPLSAINWYAEMLLNGDAGKLKTEQLEYVKEISDGNHRMVGLVNALLNVSRIEMGTLAIDSEPTDLRELADSVLAELKPQLLQKKQKVATNYDKNLPKINLDSKIMRVVWQNFLSNAVKYTPDKGKITVGIAVKGKDALISVVDTGYGIPKNQQDKIFTKLFRADNIREKVTDGTGLGLYIIKSIIEQFGGKVWFESVENKGTTFYASIPLKGVSKKEGSKGLS